MIEPLSSDAIQRHRRFDLEALHKLADRAEKLGIRIVQEARSKEHFAVDRRAPVAYAVSVTECSCKEFRLWGRCPHHALLLSELGLIPDLADVPWPGEEVTPASSDDELVAIGAD